MHNMLETKRTLTEEHLQALARGRSEGAIVRRYLNLLDERKPRRGKQISVDELNFRIDQINSELKDCSAAADRLKLIKKRKSLEARLSLVATPDELSEAEDAFVEIAFEYSQRKGIGFDVFREAGVPSKVLKRAKVSAR
mgnify:FL=1